jgi:hypothetical protein
MRHGRDIRIGWRLVDESYAKRRHAKIDRMAWANRPGAGSWSGAGQFLIAKAPAMTNQLSVCADACIGDKSTRP